MFIKLLSTFVLVVYTTTGFSQHRPSNNNPAEISLDVNDLSGRTRLVTRSVTLTDEENYLLQKPALETSMINILLNGINTGAIKAYEGGDESLMLTWEQLALLLKADTSFESPTLIPDSVTKMSFKEEWIFQREKGRMLVHITNIAPIIKVRDTAGVIREKPAFWLHYADIREYLATQKVTNSKNKKARNVRDVLDGRYFTSVVVSASE